MTKKYITSFILTIVAIFLVWYGYQEYKRSQATNIMAQAFITN